MNPLLLKVLTKIKLNDLAPTNQNKFEVSYAHKINKNEFQIKIYICKKVWKECQHKWERCSFDDDDLCKYRCKKCTLYNNDYFYT